MSDKPNCFGMYWDAADKKCSGGLDPTFQDEDGSHVRDRCLFFTACGTRTQAQKLNIVPVSNLTQQTQSAPAAQPVQQTQPVQQPQQVRPMVQQPPHQYVPQPQYQQQPVQYMAPPQVIHMMHPPQQQQPPMQTMPVNYSMPTYLTVPEYQQDEDDSIFSVAMRTIARGMIKGGCQSFVYMIDTTPIKRR